MNEQLRAQKHAFMFFTKAPTPGLTKTRLTSAKGGFLTPEEATDLYRAVMLDVAEIGHAALEQLNAAAHDKGDSYDFVVCSSPASDLERVRRIFEETFPWPIRYITDHGKNFNEHFDDGFKQLWKLGYHSAVSIGGDLPSMPVSHIVRAFQWLAYFDSAYETGGLVFCPCQACGVSLVGLTEKTPMDFDGVFYNADGTPALDAIIALSEARSIPAAALDPVSDIDNAEDLAHALSLARSHAYVSQFQPEVMVPKRFLVWADATGIVVNTPPNLDHDPREAIDA
jgi:uncharacterized protein